MAEGQSLDVLMQYTTFHITVYVTLTTVFIGASVFKKLSHWLLRWAVACFLVAGACGGIIAASAADYTGPAGVFFSQPHLTLWWFGPWCFKPFSMAEHLAFWVGLLPISIAYVLCGRSYLARGLGP